MTTFDLETATRDQLVDAYRVSEARFHALFENAADVMLIIAADGRVKRISRSARYVNGYDPKDVEGRLSFDFIHPGDLEQTRSFLAETFATTDPVKGPPFRGLDASGSWRVFEPVGLNLLDEPAIEGALFIARDVTDRHDLEQRVRQAERLEAIGQLAGGIAHDFNNVLLVIRGYSSVLRSALEDSALIADVDEIAKAAERATDLTRQLLAFARKQVLQPTLVDLRDVVLGIETLLRRSVREDIEMELDVEHDVAPVLADPSQMEQVLLNLVLNARDAMANGGRIVISLSPAVLEAGANVTPPVEPGSYVALSVSDSGDGIDAADLPRIFEPFFTTKEDGVGTGLGLSTVYGIVAQSGGAIEVAAPPTGGTRMTVFLPAAPGAVACIDGDGGSVAVRDGSETILVVEDEDPVRELVSRVLETAGYNVVSASRPSEAQDVIATTPVDLLLTDVVMPEMSGYDLAARVRLSQPQTLTLFMSGYAHKALAETAETPIGEVLRKPFSPEDLTRAVRSVLDGEPVHVG